MSEKSQNRATIGITTFNRLPLSKICLESLLKNTHGDFELIVADNHSNDGTQTYLQSLYNDKIINKLILFDKNYGIAPASNSIWETCNDNYYIKLDNDIEIKRSDWLQELLNINHENQNKMFTAFSFLKQLRNIEYPLIKLDSGHYVQKPQANMGGACICIPSEVHAKLGFWSEDYSPYGEEDTDYCIRARLAGIPYYYMRDSEALTHLYLKQDASFDASEYRKFKNQHRDKNTSEHGVFTKNLKLYQYGIRHLYMKRKFKSIQIDETHFRLELNREYSSEYSQQLKKLLIIEAREK